MAPRVENSFDFSWGEEAVPYGKVLNLTAKTRRAKSEHVVAADASTERTLRKQLPVNVHFDCIVLTRRCHTCCHAVNFVREKLGDREFVYLCDHQTVVT